MDLRGRDAMMVGFQGTTTRADCTTPVLAAAGFPEELVEAVDCLTRSRRYHQAWRMLRTDR